MKDKEKQIEEMAKVLNECCNFYDKNGVHLGNKCNSHDCEYWCDTNYICCSYNKKEATALYNAGYRKTTEDSVVLSKEEYEKYKSAIWLTPKEYQQYRRFLVEWNCGKIKRVNQDNSKNGIVHLARRKNEANGYDIEKDKLIYFSNLLDGYKHEFKDLQEICDEMNGLHKRFDSYEEQLDFWKSEAQTYKLWKEKLVEELNQVSKETAEKIFKMLISELESNQFLSGKRIIMEVDVENLAKQFDVEIEE